MYVYFNASCIIYVIISIFPTTVWVFVCFWYAGIDVEQFTNDPNYKHDIILSLARWEPPLKPSSVVASLSCVHRIKQTIPFVQL